MEKRWEIIEPKVWLEFSGKKAGNYCTKSLVWILIKKGGKFSIVAAGGGELKPRLPENRTIF